MITCKLCGGLGNQLFQIFATISYAIKYKTTFVFLYSEISPSITHRITYWNTFLKSLKEFTTTNHLPENNFYISEKSFNYIDLEIPTLNNTNVCINGYFQSYKYFENYENIILKLIMFEEVKKGLIEHLQITDTFFNNSASIHFRLGDYKHLQDCHPIIALEYYEKSILFLQENNTINKIYFFCENEDINYVLIQINKLKLKFPDITFIHAFHELPDWQQLILMSCCNHNIIGNSTFSWWGAYFNTNPGRVVCYPYIWFGPKIQPRNTSDLFPPSWRKINW
jgi:hypothetical protein